MSQHDDTSLDPPDTTPVTEAARASEGLDARALASSLRATLLASPLLDELTTGLLVVALPLIRDEFHLTYEQAGFLFTVGALSSMLFEPLINLLSDRVSKRLFIVCGMFSLVMSFTLTGAASSYGMLLLAFALISPGFGAALDLAQATLIDAAPHVASRTMTRWTVMASVGDLLAPLTVGIVTGFGLPWRVLCVLGAALWLVAAVFTWPQRFPQAPISPPADDATAERSLWQTITTAFIEALRDRTLRRWAGVVLVCTMLDEVFLAFMGLYLHDGMHATTWELSLGLGALLVGGLLGLVVLDRVHAQLARRGATMRSDKVLLWLAVVVLTNIIMLLVTHTLWVVIVTLFFIGAGASGWYPLAKAAAYDMRPGRTGVVRAVLSLGAPLDIVLPAAIGIVAGHFGIMAGIAFLGLAPLAVLALIPYGRSNRSGHG